MSQECTCFTTAIYYCCLLLLFALIGAGCKWLSVARVYLFYNCYLLLLFNTAIYYSYLLLNLLSGCKWLSVGKVFVFQHTSAYVSARQHTSAYVSIRQHTSAYIPAVGATSALALLLLLTTAFFYCYLLLLFTTAIYYCYLLLNQLSGDKRLSVGEVCEDATEKRELVYCL